MLADVHTPVAVYLRMRDRFRDTILMESTDFHAAENNFSIIAIDAIAGIEITNEQQVEYKLPGEPAKKLDAGVGRGAAILMDDFMKHFEIEEPSLKPVNIAQGLFGYTAYDAIPLFEKIEFDRQKVQQNDTSLPFMRYRLYQYVIIFDHFHDELYLCENIFAGSQSKSDDVESLLKHKDIPVFPFSLMGDESANVSNQEYMDMVNEGIKACRRGDVFQVVLSRRFQQAFRGDEFNVYRALRTVNPSPYLFYFDYGDYKLMGSSPESQLIISNGRAIVHPIAGTFKRTGNDETDKLSAIALENDPKENAEHVMLVDLARNDLSRVCNNVAVTAFKQIRFFSHVIHMVSEVSGEIRGAGNPFTVLGSTFPAGTLSGAPKYKSMEIIDTMEKTARGFYGGAIGFIGFNGDCNHAIMIRSFYSKNNSLYYQAGAGVVAASLPQNELQEVNNKLAALKKAIELAQNI